MGNSMGSAQIGELDGCRVLILEDEYFLAADLVKELDSRGARIVGPISDLDTAQAQMSRDGFDVAVIDVKLGEEFAWSIADRLMREDIPFIFVTGYRAADMPERFRSITTLEKPCDMSSLSEGIRLLCPLSKAKHQVQVGA